MEMVSFANTSEDWSGLMCFREFASLRLPLAASATEKTIISAYRPVNALFYIIPNSLLNQIVYCLQDIIMISLQG